MAQAEGLKSGTWIFTRVGSFYRDVETFFLEILKF